MSVTRDIREGLEATPELVSSKARVFEGEIPQGALADTSTPIVLVVGLPGPPSTDDGSIEYPRFLARVYHRSRAKADRLRGVVKAALVNKHFGRAWQINHAGGPTQGSDTATGWYWAGDNWSTVADGGTGQ